MLTLSQSVCSCADVCSWRGPALSGNLSAVGRHVCVHQCVCVCGGKSSHLCQLYLSNCSFWPLRLLIATVRKSVSAPTCTEALLGGQRRPICPSREVLLVSTLRLIIKARQSGHSSVYFLYSCHAFQPNNICKKVALCLLFKSKKYEGESNPRGR